MENKDIFSNVEEKKNFDFFIHDEEAVNFEKMKVVDLRKKLKEVGLAASGTKAELIERLQDYMNGEDKASTDPGGADEASTHFEDPFDADDSINLQVKYELNMDDSFVDSSTNMEDISLSYSEREKPVIKEEPNTAYSSDFPIPSSLPIPLKKRVFIETTDMPAASKKIKLKRDNVSSWILRSERVKTYEPITFEQSVNVVKLTGKSLTDAERRIIRAKRFNIPVNEAVPNRGKTPVASTFSRPASSVPVNYSVTSLEAFKKRGERFGVNVSSVMKKLESDQKVLKRAEKFGALGAVTGNKKLDDQEKLKKRLERFGI